MRRIDKQADAVISLDANRQSQIPARSEDDQGIKCIKTAIPLVTQHQKQREVRVER